MGLVVSSLRKARMNLSKCKGKVPMGVRRKSWKHNFVAASQESPLPK